LAILGLVILLIASRALRETLHRDDRKAKGFEGVNRRFIAVFRDRIFVALLLIGMAQTIALFSYLNNIPFLYQDTFGLSPVGFSMVFSITALAWFSGIQLGAKFGRIFKAHWVVLAALALSGVAGLGLFLVGEAGGGLISVIPLMALYMISFGLAVTPVQTIALQGHGSEAGTAASVMGVMNSFTAAIGAPLYPLVGSASSSNLGLMVLGMHAIAVAVFFFILRPKTVPDLVAE
ncbi:MAG: MFS transporter, partial [Actinomycetota bacterium]